MELTGYDAVLLHEFLGERKLANLLKLQEQARSFQRGDFLGLADFIARLAEFVVRQPDEPLAATHSEDTDVVRLMTVHQSKGLGVSDRRRAGHESAAARMARRVHLDERLGPLARPPTDDGEPRATTATTCGGMPKRPRKPPKSSRLLYVATTRAADYLLLSGGVQERWAMHVRPG